MQDGGDPNVHASPRDIVYSLDASKAGKEEPLELAATNMRFGGIAFGSDSLALLYESEWKSRRSKTWLFSPAKLFTPELVFDLNYEDSYNDLRWRSSVGLNLCSSSMADQAPLYLGLEIV